MKIEINDFGPIRKFDFDVESDFAFIIGQNNIGKSYAISLIYILLKCLTHNEFLDGSMFNGYVIDEVQKKIPSSVRDDFHKGYKSVSGKTYDATDLYNRLLEDFFRLLFLSQFEKSILGTYGDVTNLENRKGKDGKTSIALNSEFANLEIGISNGKVSITRATAPYRVSLRPSKQKRNPKLQHNELLLYVPADDSASALESLIYRAFNHFLEFLSDARARIRDVHYLPASRSGLYQALSAFGQIIAELSKQRSFLSQRIELPAISEPLVDYFLKLTESRLIKKGDDNQYAEIADELEKEVLEGAVEFDPKSKRLFYKPFDLGLRLDLSSTSSMVSEVAPIVTYLRQVLPGTPTRRGFRRSRANIRSEGKQILFIEEPEAHLHPRNQAILMTVFAKLVRECDVKIVMTSHSNFVFNKISNLLIGGSFGASRTAAFLFKSGNDGTTGTPLDVDEFGISDENFTTISEDLFNERISLIENNQGDAE